MSNNSGTFKWKHSTHTHTHERALPRLVYGKTCIKFENNYIFIHTDMLTSRSSNKNILAPIPCARLDNDLAERDWQ